MYEVWTEGTIWYEESREECDALVAEFIERGVPFCALEVSAPIGTPGRKETILAGDYVVIKGE